MPPRIIFLVPYRDRKEHQEIYSKHMENILTGLDDYKIIYIHQMDTRSFNRGAMKNIGFLYVKEQYPDTYKEITLVFNDVDIMPKSKNIIDYYTETGTIKHHYGYSFTLGGILSIKASDFELIGGFPNFWAWGYEDNALQQRAIKHNLKIDRNNMYEPGSKEIIHMKDSVIKTVNKEEYQMYRKESKEGYKNITDLNYYYNDSSGFLNVTEFNTGREENTIYSRPHKLSNGNKPFQKRNPKMNMLFS
jgi:hypothetical protein